MHNTAVAHPAELVAKLERIRLADLLDGYIARERVGIRFVKLERIAEQHGYRFEREHGNLYGKLMLVPIPPAPTNPPVMRVITRSDHAAVHGSRLRRVA